MAYGDYTTLPSEIWIKIFSHLDARSIGSVKRTCKLFDAIIADNDQVWANACYPCLRRGNQNWRMLCEQLHRPEDRLLEQINDLKQFLNVRRLANGSFSGAFDQSRWSYYMVISGGTICFFSYYRRYVLHQSQLYRGLLTGSGTIAASLVATWNRQRKAGIDYQRLLQSSEWRELSEAMEGRDGVAQQSAIRSYLSHTLEEVVCQDHVSLRYAHEGSHAFLADDQFLFENAQGELSVGSKLIMKEIEKEISSEDFSLDQLRDLSSIPSYRATYAMLSRKRYLLQTAMGVESMPDLKSVRNELVAEYFQESQKFRGLAAEQISVFIDLYEGNKNRQKRLQLKTILNEELSHAEKGAQWVEFTPLLALGTKFDQLS